MNFEGNAPSRGFSPELVAATAPSLPRWVYRQGLTLRNALKAVEEPAQQLACIAAVTPRLYRGPPLGGITR